MRRSLPAQDASAAFAFQQIFIDADVPAAAELITRAASMFTSFGQLSTVDAPTARAIVVAAIAVNDHFGGLGRARTGTVGRYTAARRAV